MISWLKSGIKKKKPKRGRGMSWTEEGKIAVGETAYSFAVHWNDRAEQECVKLYTGDLAEYITQFQNIREMKEFLNHAEPKDVNLQIEEIISFRRFCREEIKKFDSKERVLGSLEDKEKQENTEVFMKRMHILRGEMNARQFAFILGLNAGTVQNLLNGQRTPGGHIFKRIADKTGMSADWLIGRK